MKTRTISFFSFCGLIAGFFPLALTTQASGAETPPVFTNQIIKERDEDKPAPAAANADAAKKAETDSPQLSPALRDIVKLTRAGVDESVVLAYIRNSRVASRLSAQEVIKLRELGVSATIITALLQRAEESPPPPAVNPPAPQPVSTTQSASTYYVPSPSPVVAPTVVYAAEPYYYPSVGWYGYGGYYPGYYSGCYPSAGFYGGFYPGISVGLRFGGHVGFGHHHHHR